MIFLSISYLRGKNNEIVVKEMGMVKLNPNGSDSHVQCFLFEPPYGEYELSDKIRKTNRYMTRQFHGIRWADGHIPYSQLCSILTKICKDEVEVYAKGSEQATFFANRCGKFVLDLDHLGCAKVDSIAIKPTISCSLPHTKHCAMAKCLKYADWMKTTMLAKQLRDTLSL
jgi:hypothetical protein